MLEKLLLSPAFIGVIGVVIGSALSLFGTVLSQIILSRKEQKQWENQQKAEKTAWERSEQKKEKEYLREIYQNSLQALSIFISIENQKEETKGQQQFEVIEEIHKWVTKLLLRHSNPKLYSAFNEFANDPDEYEAKGLIKQIIELSNQEESFFLKQLNTVPEKTEKSTNPDLRNIHIVIDDNFRKQQIIDGVEIPQRNEIKIKLSEMSNSQREKLTEIYFKHNKTIPLILRLYLPIHDARANQIQIRGKEWQAKINPACTGPCDILTLWEEDYTKSYEVAERSLKTSSKK